MAIAIGTGTGEIQTGTAFGAYGVNITYPTNKASGDLIFAFVNTNAGNFADETGWTTVAFGSGYPWKLYWRLYSSGSSVDFDLPDTNRDIVGGMFRVTGASTTNPVLEAAAAANTTTSAPSLECPKNNCLLINFYWNTYASTWTPDSGQTELWDVRTNDGVYTDVSSCATKLAVNSGSTGSKSATPSPNVGGYSYSMIINTPGTTAEIKKIAGVSN